MQSTNSKNFTPLKLYSHGSILTSINKIDKLVKLVKDNGFKSAALVDLENVFMAVDFYKAMKKAGLKAIIGCGLTVGKVRAITFIAKNKTGWKNLLKLIHQSYINNVDSPYIKISDINPEGLACLVGSPYSWHSVEEHEYIDAYLSLANLFKNDIYVEVHPNYRYIAELLDSMNHANYVSCCDVFYIKDEDKVLNDILIATKLKKKINDPEVQDHFLVKNSFKYQDISNLESTDCSTKLADSIEDLNLLQEPQLPKFSNGDVDKELEEICYKRLKELDLSEEHEKRLKHELDVIKDAGFSSYFLIVQDIIRYAKSQNMMIGGSRGCLGSDTNVFLDDGRVKRINRVNIGDRVICADGSSQKVLDLFMYKNYDPMYKIVSYYGDSVGLRVTPEHQVLTKGGYKRADQLTKKDMVFFPKISARKNMEYDLDDYKRAYLLGLFAGDGWIRSDRNSAAYIVFGLKDIMPLTKACNFLNHWGYKYTIQFNQEDNIYTVSILSPEVYNFFREAFHKYDYSSHTKHVPNHILSNTKLAKEFLVGYNNADGTNEVNGLKYTTVSKDLAYQVRFLHHMLNIPATTSIYETDKRKEYYVRSKSKPKYAEVTDNGFFAKIKSIEVEEPDMYVYDIEVENQRNYLTTNGIVHNSVGGAITSYLSRITDIDPLQYGLIFERFYNSSRNFESHISFEEIDYVKYKNQNI